MHGNRQGTPIRVVSSLVTSCLPNEDGSEKPGDALKIAVQPNGLGVGGNAPFRSSEKDADVRGVEVHNSRRDGISLHGLIDGRKNDDVLCHVNDGTAASEIGDDFVFMLLLGKSVKRGYAKDAAHKKESDSPRKSRAQALSESRTVS